MATLLTRRTSSLVSRPTHRLGSIITYPALRQQAPQRLNHTFETPINVFSRLAPWAQSTLHSSSDCLVSVRIRNQDSTPFLVQRALLDQIADTTTTAPFSIRHWSSGPTLDLTAFEEISALVFLFWLYRRRLPALERDCLSQQQLRGLEVKGKGDEREKQAMCEKQKSDYRAAFVLGLIDAWRLGHALRSAGFQNDVLLCTASLISQEEGSPSNRAISWARRAFDATADLRHGGGELREFAVDVAAKRVYDVGVNGWVLSAEERLDLSSCSQFGGEVFGSLGGQIGLKGVGVKEMGRGYLVDDGEGEKKV